MSYQPTGIIHITGEPDTGKTLLALGAYPPKQTAYFFDDVKRPPINDSEFGLFVDMVKDYGDLKVLELYQAVMDKIEKMKEYDAIIFDTWARTGKAIRYYAKANPYEFREQSTFSANGTIKNMEQWGETHNVEAAVISKLSQKCKVLFLITHIKEKIIAGARSGLNEPDCGKSFGKVCNMRLWLRHNEHSGVPIALVLKRISKVEINKGAVDVVNVLPRRIQPAKGDRSVWQAIDRYWQEPVGNREPLENEIPSPFELSILDGTLTADQKEVWQAELREKDRQEKEEAELFNLQFQEQSTRAKELADGLTGAKPMIAKSIQPQLIEEFGPEFENLDRVKELLK